MGLQVWLPLTKDTNNYGVSSSKITVSNAVLENAGKLGGCYNFNSNKYMGLDAANVNNHKYTNISLACWAYFTATDSYERYIIGCWESGGGGLAWQNQKIDFILYAGGTYRTVWTPTTLTLNTWHHICGTYDGKTMVLYIDGTSVGTLAVNATITYQATTPWEIGGNPNPGSFSAGNLTGKLNDMRIYDHALSAKEVEEIAKGLVVHYKLDDAYAESTTNILGTKSSDFSGWISYTHSWSSIADNEFGTKSLIMTDQITWCGARTSFSIPSAGTYTLSVYCKPISRTSTAISQKLYFSAGEYSDLSVAATWDNPGSWQRISMTKTFSAACSGTLYLIAYGGTQNVDKVSCEYTMPQIEKSDHATPYTPTSRTATTVCDVSGFGNNGTINGTLTTSSDTRRYSASTVFNGSSWIDAGTPTNNIKDEITFGCYAYHTNWASATYQSFLSQVESGGIGFQIQNNTTAIHALVGTGTSSNTYVASIVNTSTLSAGWHMFYCTFDGHTNNFYIDGELKATATSAATGKVPIFYSTNKLFIGAECSGVNPQSGNKFNGKVSDVRIYATALTVEQIKELYNTSASVANNGTFFAREFIE